MGMGGGTLLIPILTLLLGVSQHVAQGVNMIAFLPGAIVAILIHKKSGRIEMKKGTPLLLLGFLGAIGGALAATFLDAHLLRKGFGAFLILLAVLQYHWGEKNRGMQ